MNAKNEQLKVFVVEDNELYSLMIDHKLKDIGNYHITTFTSGEDCLKNLYLEPDVIILDYYLTGMTGLETLPRACLDRTKTYGTFLSSQRSGMCSRISRGSVLVTMTTNSDWL